ncbi:MAG: 50S ribosomal protein L25 [Clostridium sp.]|uniref:50S ribosomal protein L25 n=1 Tax=Clostridium sp. TaxID=1506 RepID=UPI002671ED51|nr:50S ribosomal protein L25 [Clostridium sp.]MCI7029564.1 50S ribosomal protein L25 [Clostridium sp.]MDD7683150.1 50S ribosomal protein L25 [Clostridium sp.]MDY2581271.1 50S ribosomal protein L25 [Clostridium sp.]
MESVVFNVSERNEKGKKVRMHGEVPAVLYGSHLDNTVSIKITRKDMYKLLTLAKSSILSLKLNGHIENCVVKELQKDSFGKVIHIDFQDIKKDEKIKMKIPVVFDGQSTLEGRQLLLEVLISEVELYGEADKLPENIKCNVGELNIGDKIFIKDLVIPEGMRLDVDENAIVATIADNSAVDTDEDQSEDGTESKQ